MLLYNRFDEVAPFVRQLMDDLIHGRISIDELKVSRSYKGPLKYKNFRQVQLQVVLKLEDRHRWPVPEKSRVFFVVTRGKDKLYMRSETPEYVKAHNLELDLEYYMTRQFFTPMKKLLSYHPHLMHFEKEFNDNMLKLNMITNNQSSIGDVSNRKRMSLADLQRNRMNKPVTSVKRRKAITAKPDPFAHFKRK